MLEILAAIQAISALLQGLSGVAQTLSAGNELTEEQKATVREAQALAEARNDDAIARALERIANG